MEHRRGIGEEAARRVRRRHDGLQDGARPRPRATWTRPSRSCARRAWPSADKKSARAANEGMIDYYIHPGGKVGVLVEVNCETDFVARNEDFKAFVHDVAMHIAAASPAVGLPRGHPRGRPRPRRSRSTRPRPRQSGKPEAVIEKIAEGKLNKWYERGRPARAAVRQGPGQDHRRPAARARRQDRREHRDQAVRALPRGRRGGLRADRAARTGAALRGAAGAARSGA